MNQRFRTTTLTALAVIMATLTSCGTAVPENGIGLQLYSVREAMKEDPVGTIEKVGAIGYDFVESAGYNDGKIYGMEPLEFKALVEKNKHVSYLLAEDEGHGFRKPVNRMAMYAEIEHFLSEELGGRFQKDKPEEVDKRLQELLVDANKLEHKNDK